LGALEKFFENLREKGVGTSLETAKAGILETLNPFDNTRNLGRIALQSRSIDNIDVEGIYTGETQAGPAGTRKVLRLAGVNLDYVLKGHFRGKKDLLKAKLHVKKKGLLHPKVVEMNWEGSAVASELNNDKEVNDLLWQSIGQLSAKDIEVKTEEDTGEVKIHVRDDRQVFRGELPPFQMYEKIAEHIYTLAGTSKTVRPSPPKQAAVSQPIMETAEIKYCFKCGTDMPQDAVFCPKCGTKQD
jgi:ribosomal protein L40E